MTSPRPRVAFASSDEENDDDVMLMTSPYAKPPPLPPASSRSRTVDEAGAVAKKTARIEPMRPSSAMATASPSGEWQGRKKRVSSATAAVTERSELTFIDHPNRPSDGDERASASKALEKAEEEERRAETEQKKKEKEKRKKRRKRRPADSSDKPAEQAQAYHAAPLAPTGGNQDFAASYASPQRDRIDKDAVRPTALGQSAQTACAPIAPGMTPSTRVGSSAEAERSNDAFELNETSKEQEDHQESMRHKITSSAQESYEIGAAAATNAALPRKLKSTLHFHDGKRKIDFVMAYVDDDSGGGDDGGGGDVNKYRRQFYEEALKEKGLEIEIEPKEESQDQLTCFVKVHVPYPVLLTYAERMRLKMPLKEDRQEDGDQEDQQEFCDHVTCTCIACTQPFRLDNPELEDREDDNYTAEFVRDKIEFFDIKDKEHFFTDAQRSRIAYRIMNETRYGDDRCMVGITKLINDGTYESVYPLHDGAYDVEKFEIANQANMRGLLYREWGRWGRWYKFQPLDAVRKYFGDKIALYFAWLGFYTEMLVYPTVVGLICMVYSCVSLTTYPPVKEVCDPSYPTYAGDLVMCPQCDKDCGFWNLSTSCVAAEITHVFDNNSTIFFAIFMSLWATTFLEIWKRRQFKLNYEWDLVDYDEERDLIRPEFEAKVTRERINPVTRKMEPFLSAGDRCTRVCFSAVTVFFWVIVVCAAVIAVIIYRIVISSVFAYTIDPDALGAIGSYATPSLLTTVTGSLLSLLLIMALNAVYERIAVWLTDLELPRTQIEFEDSFTFKMFCFQFVNYYSYLFYVAFLKNLLAGLPPAYNYFVGTRWEECDAGGCMYELSLQLVIIMFGKQLWNNVVEIVWPWAVTKYRQWRSAMTTQSSPSNLYTRWEQDYDLQPFQQLALFYEYLEMVIQFGFATLFVSAFPLAPALALINNIFEIRLDANKLICESRRPIAQKCSDIGVWYYLLDFLGTLAVITNAFTIAFTSQSIPKLVYYYVYSLDYFDSRTMQGFTNNSLAVFDVNDFSEQSKPATNPDNIEFCRYRAYRTPPGDPNKYETTKQYWHVIAAQLAFVIVMEHVVMLCKWLIDYIVPDRPKKLQTKIKREHYLVQEVMVKAEASTLLKRHKLSLKSTDEEAAEVIVTEQPQGGAREAPDKVRVVKETTEL